MGNSEILQKVEGIFDIHPPVEPTLTQLEVGLAALLCILVGSYISYYIRCHLFSNKNKYKRKIMHLKSNFTHDIATQRKTVYQLCNYLQKALNIHQLGSNSKLPIVLQQHTAKWQLFISQLSELRYTENTSNVSQLNSLFDESIDWIKMWPK